MIKRTTKTVAIVFLAASAIYLTGQLWFTEISGRSFSYILSSISPSNRVNIENERSQSLSSPYRIITGSGDDFYTIIYSNLKTNEKKKTADKIITEVLTSGSYSSIRTLDYAEILKGNVCIYEYAVSLPSDAFCRSLGIKTGTMTGKVKEFDKIVLKQSNFDRSVLSVIVVDTNKTECHEFLLKDAVLSADFSNSFYQTSDNTNDIAYISSTQSGYTIINGNVFIPFWDGDGFLYSTAISENPYTYKGQLLLNTIEKKVDIFFDKPASKWSGTPNDVFTYSDESTVVKYYQNNVLEYSYYGSATQKTTPSFEADYYTALSFIDKDAEVINEYYLASYNSDATQSVFCFNYVENNFPIKLSNSVISETGMRYPIEITIENGRVRKYKKFAFTFKKESETQESSGLKFDEYIRSFAVNADQQEITFDDVSFCYNMDNSNQLLLYWFLSTEGITYSQSTKIDG